MGLISRIFPRVRVVFDHTFLTSFLDERSIVVDVGANVGGFAIPVADAFKCTVFACEPVPEIYRRIPERPNVRKFPYCITRAAGTVTLVIPDDNCASTYYPEGKEHSHSVAVEGVTYRRFLEETGLTSVDLLKADIEGAEIDMIDSLSDVELRIHKQLAIEFHEFIFPELKSETRRIEERIVRAGYYRIPFSVGTVDVLFIRDDVITYAGYLYLLLCVRYYYKLKDVAVRVKRKLDKISRGRK